jgi:hypothetical protein
MYQPISFNAATIAMPVFSLMMDKRGRYSLLFHKWKSKKA